MKPVLDVCCGSKMFWFDRHDERAIYCDRRRETKVVDVGTPGTKGRKPKVIDPDKIMDFRRLDFPDNQFHHIVFDPPHIKNKTIKNNK